MPSTGSIALHLNGAATRHGVVNHDALYQSGAMTFAAIGTMAAGTVSAITSVVPAPVGMISQSFRSICSLSSTGRLAEMASSTAKLRHGTLDCPPKLGLWVAVALTVDRQDIGVDDLV